MKFQKGDRVTHSDLYKERFRLIKPNKGVILRHSYNEKNVVVVLWDKTKVPKYIHEDFLELVSSNRK